MYRVRLTNFEGPLDLLAQLIETNKLEITEISLAQVADQFLAYLKNKQTVVLDSGLRNWPGFLTPSVKDVPTLGVGANFVSQGLEELADFLAVAGRLVLIKSRSLLPYLEVTAEEEGDIQSLKDQLAEYRRYCQLAKEIGALDRSAAICHSRNYLQNIEPVFYFPSKLKTAHLAAALENLLQTITLPQRIPQARVIDIVSLEQKLAEVVEVLKNSAELKFSQLLKSNQTEEKVVTFLTVLELLKQGRAQARQVKNFEEIILTCQNQPVN